MGRHCDLQRWEPDDRRAGGTDGHSWLQAQSYHPPSAPAWLRTTLEPVRLALFPDLMFHAPILLSRKPPRGRSSRPPPEHAALLLTRVSQSPKEVYILRHPRAVLVYNVVEHGRRWYRKLVFSSDQSCSLADLPTCLAHPPPTTSAASFACGDPLESCPPSPSLVITRSLSADHEQQFIPRRLLQGLLPAALLERYDFWQSHHSAQLTGYP